jgi:membrane dipeptidase
VRAGAYCPYAQFFALWAPPDLIAREGNESVFRREYRVFRREIKKNEDKIAHCRTMEEARRAAATGKAAAFLSVEGAQLLGCSTENLGRAWRLGVRAINLTWNRSNVLSGAHDHEPERGLSPEGRVFVLEMQRLGILVDVSHLSERGFWDVMELAKRPVLASHSNARALKNHTRNLTDRQFTAIIKTGGVAGLNLYAGFLGNAPTVETALDHIEHFLDLGGAKHLCLGFDLDGGSCDTRSSGIRGIEDAYPRL